MTSSNVNTHFCKGELQRKVYSNETDTVHMYVCLSNSSAKVFPTGHTHSHVNVFLFFLSSFFFCLSLVTDISLRQSVSTFYETEYLTIFFCLFVDMHICTHTHTCKDICIRDSFYPHTIQFMHSSPTKIPPDPIPINTDPPKPPLQHPTGLYNVNMYSTRTLSKNKIKLKKRNYKHIFEKKGCPFSFLQR